MNLTWCLTRLVASFEDDLYIFDIKSYQMMKADKEQSFMNKFW